MAYLFISHSSKDLQIARSVSEELVRLGHQVWLDEWEIKVGDSIVQKVNKGLEDCSHVILLLSEHSVVSKWVEKEWSSVYMDEIESGKVRILPARLDSCEIPRIIRDKKYADFRESFTHGMIQMTAVLSPTIKSEENISREQVNIPKDKELYELIAESQTGQLSTCLAKAISIAKRYGDDDFLAFCQGELTGWTLGNSNEVKEKAIDYRVAELLFSPFKKINLNAPHWRRDPNAVLDFLRNEEDVYAMSYFIPNMISDLETQMRTEVLSTGVLTLEIPIGYLIPKIKGEQGRHKISVYGHPKAIPQILNGVRSKLTTHLIALLPAIKE